MARRAVFLDRDGVLDDPVPRAGGGPFESPLDAEAVRLVPGAIEGIVALRAAGFVIVAVSNQPGAAKGQCTLESLQGVHDRVVGLLGAEGVSLDGWYYCHHHPEGVDPALRQRCSCRKPEPGLLFAAAEERDLDLGASWMIGDSDADIVAGRRAGCRTVLVEHPETSHRRGAEDPDLRVPDLAHAWVAMRPLTPPRRLTPDA